jgi:hypothetical protein
MAMLTWDRRHLVRLWLRDPEHAWPTPGPLTERWRKVYDGVQPQNEVFPLEPRIRSASEGNVANDGKAEAGDP